MRILKIKSTDRIIEMQSNATEGTLLNNALSRGYNVNEVEESVVTQEQYKALMDVQNENDKTYVEKRQAEYGTNTHQIENIIENGLEAEQTRIQAIKDKYPKENS